MNYDLKVVIKKGTDLTPQEIDSVNDTKFLEWRKLPMDDAHRNERIFVLLKDSNENILAQAQLHRINDVTFHSETFSVLDIGAVIAHIKGMGYGERLMKGVMEYLKENNEIGMGFTGKEIVQFFKKCGFAIDCDLLKRFVLFKNGNKQPYSERDCIFYYDPTAKLFSKVLSTPDKEVVLPRDPDW